MRRSLGYWTVATLVCTATTARAAGGAGGMDATGGAPPTPVPRPATLLVASPCSADEVENCASAPLAFTARVPMPALVDVDTGWIPPNSSLQVRFGVGMPGATDVTLDGAFVTRWPEALTVGVQPATPGGTFGFDWGLDVIAKLKIDATLGGVGYRWEGNIPFVPAIDFALSSYEELDGWAVAPAVPVTGVGRTSPVRFFTVNLLNLVSIPSWLAAGGVALDVRGELEGTYRSLFLVVWPVGADAPLELTAGLGRHPPPGGAFAEYDVWIEGTVDYAGSIHLLPTATVKIIGIFDLNIPLYDFPIPVAVPSQTIRFEPVRVHIPLPNVVSPTGPLEFEPVEVGDAGYLEVELANAGEAPLKVALAEPLPRGPLALTRPNLTIPPGGSGTLRFRYTPRELDELSTTVVLATNDPDAPRIELALHGSSFEPSGTGSGGTGGRSSLGGAPAAGENPGGVGVSRGPGAADSGGCGCRTPRHPAPMAPALASLLAVLGATTCRRSRRPSRAGSRPAAAARWSRH